MPEPQANPAKSLCDEILTQARRDAEEITQCAREQAGLVADGARAEVERSRGERLRLAQAEAARRREAILATVPIERARLDSARHEALLESIHQEVRSQLVARQGFDYEQSLISLSVSAIARMAGDTFTIKLSAADAAAMGQRLRDGVGRRLNRAITVSEDAAIGEGGVLIQGDDGHQLWDNRFLARLERLWPQLRQQIAIRTGLLEAHNE